MESSKKVFAMEKEMKVIIDNWMEFHPVITNAELGWNEECIRDAMSEDPKEIFNYFWHNFFSIIFYYVDDHQEGTVLCEFDDDTDLWETLKIGDKSIGEVLTRSYIAEIN